MRAPLKGPLGVLRGAFAGTPEFRQRRSAQIHRPGFCTVCGLLGEAPCAAAAMPAENASSSSDYTMLDRQAQDPYRRRTFAYGALLLALVLGLILLFAPLPAASTLFLEDSDHGCDISTGARWCEARSECVHRSEVDMLSAASFEAACTLPRVGGDKDEHGCIPSAGYRWCEQKSQCVRPWERGWKTESAFNTACRLPTLGGDEDAHGCIPSAGYRWCAKRSQCLRPWEHFASQEDLTVACEEEVLPGGDTDLHGCKPSAGYQWCGKMAKCIRPWEEGLKDEADMKQACR
eukprot:s21_g4.t1